MVNVAGSGLGTVVLVVAHPAVEAAVRAVVVGQGVQQALAFHAPEAVPVVPHALERKQVFKVVNSDEACFSLSFNKATHGGGDHLLSLKDLARTLGAGVLVSLLALDHPGLDRRPRQHVVLLVVQLRH